MDNVNENSAFLTPGKNNFVKQWMKHANTKDIFLKFFIYFLALNYLYEDDYKKKHCYGRARKTETEYEKLLSFLRTVYYEESYYRNIGKVLVGSNCDLLFSVETQNSPSTLERGIKGFLPKHLFKCKSEKDENDEEITFDPILDKSLKNNIEKFNTLVAFYKIYRIRCNLFHGQKQPTNPRDKELVETANVLLEKFLSASVKDGLGIFYYEEEFSNKSSCDNTNGF